MASEVAALRLTTRRFTRLTNAFGMKWDNHRCALALWFAFYNFGRVHMTLKTETPAMASELADHVWTISELIEESAKFYSETDIEAERLRR